MLVTEVGFILPLSNEIDNSVISATQTPHRCMYNGPETQREITFEYSSFENRPISKNGANVLSLCTAGKSLSGVSFEDGVWARVG